jgi:hypothetical protein
MIAIRLAAVLSALALGACSDRAPPDSHANQAEAPIATRPQPAPAPLAAERRKAASMGCADAIAIDLDRSGIAEQEWKPYPAARIDAFRRGAADAFRAAANHACSRDRRLAGALVPVRRVLIQSGSGAADPTFFDAEPGPHEALVFQWAFVEADLAIPDRAAIETGLRCWADPERKECEDLGD